MTHRILLVDDHQLVLDGLKAILSADPMLEVVGAVNSGKAALTFLKNLEIDLVMTDIDMPEMTGIELVQEIKNNGWPAKVMVLTMHNEKSIIKQIMAIGAEGYVLKTTDQSEMLLAVKKVLSGSNYFSADVTVTLLSEDAKPAANNKLSIDLTEREREILQLIAEGFTNKEIGDKLFISHRTVDAHRTNMMKKLEVNNIAGLVRFAMQNGLID